MAKLYTRKSDGTYVPHNTQSVTNIDVVQTTGDSVTAAMSQDAVTKKLATKQNALTDTDGSYGQRVAELEEEKQDTLTPGNGISIEGNLISASVAEVVDKIVNAGYVFAGVATPSTDPGTPEAKVFYIANGKGTYTNFGGLEVTEDEVVVLYYDTEWHKVATGIASQDKLTELENHIGKLQPLTDGVDNANFWMKSGTVQSTGTSEYHVLVYKLLAGHKYVFTPTGQTYPVTTSLYGIIAYVNSDTLVAGDEYTPIVSADNIKYLELNPADDCYVAVQTRYLNPALYSSDEMVFLEYKMLDEKLDSSTYDYPADVEVIPIEGKVEDTFILNGTYTRYNTGQTFRNKTISPLTFNKIKYRLFATSDSDVLRVYKVSASLWNGKGYNTAKYSDSQFTKIYEETFGDTKVGFKEINLDENVTLGYNESLFVVIFSNNKTSVSLTSTYVQNDRSYGYPIIYCISQDIDGSSVNINYGWNEYSCYPLILTQVNPYFLKKDAASIEKRLDLLDESLMYIDKLTNKVERTGGITKLLENVSVGKNQPYHLKVSAFGGSGKVQIQFNYNDGVGYDVIEDKDIFSGFDGLFVPKRASSNGSFQVYTESASGWQSFTIEFYKEGSMPLLESIKNSDIRDVVRVLSTDTELEIFNKMYLAFSRGNCDVVFDCATYIFSDIYIYMRDTLGWTWTMGLPIGNGCRYFFNGSTLISNAPAEAYTDSRNLLDCKAIGTDYELHDGTLINNGGTYCVHDEGASDLRSYRHLYHNIIFNMDGATSCFGCGLGYKSVIEFDGCVFLSNTAGAVHGPNPNAGAVDFTIVFKNTYFADYTIGLSSLLDKTRDNLKIIFCNNSYKRLNAVDFNVMMFYNNEVRTS